MNSSHLDTQQFRISYKRKYVDHGKERVRLKSVRMSIQNGHVNLTIKDTHYKWK